MNSDIDISGFGPASVRPGPVADILDQAMLPPGTTHVTVVASDGYRASIPLDTLRTGGVVSVDKEAWRLKVLDGSTLCWNVKGIVRLEPTEGRAEDDIPEKPSH